MRQKYATENIARSCCMSIREKHRMLIDTKTSDQIRFSWFASTRLALGVIQGFVVVLPGNCATIEQMGYCAISF